MDSVRKILTPSAIWGKFKGDLPLKESKVSEMTYDKITYTEVYFSLDSIEDTDNNEEFTFTEDELI